MKNFRRQIVMKAAKQFENTERHRAVHLKMVKTGNFMLCIFCKKKKKAPKQSKVKHIP